MSFRVPFFLDLETPPRELRWMEVGRERTEGEFSASSEANVPLLRVLAIGGAIWFLGGSPGNREVHVFISSSWSGNQSGLVLYMSGVVRFVKAPEGGADPYKLGLLSSASSCGETVRSVP